MSCIAVWRQALYVHCCKWMLFRENYRRGVYVRAKLGGQAPRNDPISISSGHWTIYGGGFVETWEWVTKRTKEEREGGEGGAREGERERERERERDRQTDR